MAVSVMFVLGLGNVVISLMRNIIPSKIRIIVQLIVVATLVIIVDQVLKAFAYELSKYTHHMHKINNYFCTYLL